MLWNKKVIRMLNGRSDRYLNRYCQELENAEQVVLSYSPYIERIAHNYIKQSRNREDLKKDLVQQGYLGLLEARERFDSSKNANGFWSYACKSVSGRMKDFTKHYTNQISPSKELNSIVLKIYKNNLIHSSPEYIADYLGCTINMAQHGIEFINIRSVKSLHEQLPHSDHLDNQELIDIIQSNEDPDVMFQIEVMNFLSPIEQNVALMLIEHYSIKDISRHFKISKHDLYIMLKKILSACGHDCTTILNRNEGWLMDLDKLELDSDEFEDSWKPRLEWVHIDRVLPNPRNPRRDPSVRTKQMQDVIKAIGWEEMITCYEQGNNYIILSGHRRRYAAKQIGKTVIPIYVVKAPKSDPEELDRIGSVQGGQVDWNQYEKVKYTYDRWVASGKIPFYDLGKELGISEGLTGSRIRVYQYYTKSEIEDKLINRMYSLTMLDYIHTWIKRLKKYHPDIMNSLGEHYIRRLMLKKYENRCFNSKIANDRTFVITASPQSITEFLIDANKKLQDCQMELTDLKDNDINFTKIIYEVKAIQYGTKYEAEELSLELEKLMTCIDNKIMYLEKYS